MKLSTFAIIVTFLATAFGLAFIFIPTQVATFYGLTPNIGGIWTSRFFGSTLLFVAMIYWSYSHVSPSAKSWPKLLIFSIIHESIQLILNIIMRSDGVGNSNVWSSVVLYALLIIGSFYFLGVCTKARTS
jgi:hypothetical protein